VRSLEREISKLCRKAVKQLLLDKSLKHIEINGDNLHDYLGVQRFDYGRADNENRVGQVTGLAWTEVGGDLLTIETACVPGKGKLTYTGSLGEVMQESIQAALTVVRARAEKLGINPDFTKNATFTFTYRKERRRKMAQVRVLRCVPRWFLV
jgi:ATP-dependent Lon protease